MRISFPSPGTGLKRVGAIGVSGPVGLSLILTGYAVAVLVARAFVSLIAHCTQSCPAIRIEGFHLHHFYYGVGFVLISVTALAFVVDVRTRWDAALVLGIGAGLALDEVGLVLLRANYWDWASLAPIVTFGLAIATGLAYALRLRGASDYRILDKADVFTIISVLLGVTGFLYFVRPVRVYLTVASVASWTSAIFLMGVYGRKHLLRIRRGSFRSA
jgi:hypothetical protein